MSHVLSGLVERSGAVGIEVMRNDGQCVLERFHPAMDLGTYSRMSATLAAASERVLPMMRATRARHLVIDAGPLKVVVVEARPDLLLAALTRPDQSPEGVLRLLAAAAEGVNRLVPAA